MTKVLWTAFVNLFMLIMSKNSAQLFMIDVARKLAKKTESDGDDKLVEWFAGVHEAMTKGDK